MTAGGSSPDDYLLGVGRSRSRQRLVKGALAMLVALTAADAVFGTNGSDAPRPDPLTRPASATTSSQPTQPSPSPTQAAVSGAASSSPAAASARARHFLTGYLALLHGRGSAAALRHVAARELLRELRRNRPRVTPSQQHSGSRILDLTVAPRSPASVRAVATVEQRGGPPYALALYLERRGARWVVTRIGDV